MGVILKNDNQEIELTVKGYEALIPTKSYWDNNWLILSCKSTENNMRTIFFYAQHEDFKTTFRKYVTAEDVEELIGFCSDSLRLYPVRDIGTK